MKPSEALEILSKYTPSLEWVESNITDEDVNGCDEVLEMHEAHGVLQQLVKRDEAMKVTQRFERKELLTMPKLGADFVKYVWGFCPSCQFENSQTSKQGYTIQHCRHCGQRLDWSDEE